MRLLKTVKAQIRILLIMLISTAIISGNKLSACSTIKLQKDDQIICAYNLNEGDKDVPGLAFINKRGIFKKGRTWSELTTSGRENPSNFTWVSRYGSLTFNCFAKDLPNGGMNEEGLYITEMSEDANFPKNDDLPKLSMMSWIQYCLDSFSNVDDAVNSAQEFEIDGWDWHFFVGDKFGNTAVVEFIKGKVVIHKNDTMPIKALFNQNYARELQLLKYYQGFGGSYEIKISDPEVPRFAKAALINEEFRKSNKKIVDFGFESLVKLSVYDAPEWSIVYDVSNLKIYFKTRIFPETKQVSFKDLDFSNNSPVKILNISLKDGGNISSLFSNYSDLKMKEFITKDLFKILPEQFFTGGGIDKPTFAKYFSKHSNFATQKENQLFGGIWKTEVDENGMQLTLELSAKGDAVTGIFYKKGGHHNMVEHLQMSGGKFSFTYKKDGNAFRIAEGEIDDDEMTMKISSLEDYFGEVVFKKESE